MSEMPKKATQQVINPDGTIQIVKTLTGDVIPLTGDIQFDNYARRVLERIEDVWKESDLAYESATAAFEETGNPEHHMNITKALAGKQKALDQTIVVMKEITRYILKLREFEMKKQSKNEDKQEWDLTEYANKDVDEVIEKH